VEGAQGDRLVAEEDELFHKRNHLERVLGIGVRIYRKQRLG
jgi:hypothetical protein